MSYPKDWRKVSCNDWCEDEKSIWLSLENKNAICEIDKNSKNVKILGYFPHNGLGESDLSVSVKKCGDYVVFCPFRAKDIGIFNVPTGKLEFIDVSFLLDICEGIEIFYRMISYKKYIFFLGIGCPVIMRFDLTTKKFDLFNEWSTRLEQEKCKEGVYFTDGYAQKGDEFYLPIGKCSGVLKINLDTMEWEYIEFDFFVCGVLGMTQIENFVWFTEHDIKAKYFFQWNLENNKMIKIELPCSGIYYAPLYYKKSLFFFGNSEKESYQYELGAGKWKSIIRASTSMEYFSSKKVREDEIDFFSKKNEKFYHWNPQSDDIYYDEFQIKQTRFLENSWIDYCNRYKQELRDNIVVEGKLTIKNYIDIINTNIT